VGHHVPEHRTVCYLRSELQGIHTEDPYRTAGGAFSLREKGRLRSVNNAFLRIPQREIGAANRRGGRRVTARRSDPICTSRRHRRRQSIRLKRPFPALWSTSGGAGWWNSARFSPGWPGPGAGVPDQARSHVSSDSDRWSLAATDDLAGACVADLDVALHAEDLARANR
jgi:hypothetical protein